MTTLDVMSFLGAVFVGYCAIVGAAVVLRWGICGVHLIWRKRAAIDEEVRAEVESILTR